MKDFFRFLQASGSYLVSETMDLHSGQETLLGKIIFSDFPNTNHAVPSSNYEIANVYVTSRQKALPISVSTPTRLSALEAAVLKLNGKFYRKGRVGYKPLLMSFGPGNVAITAEVSNEVKENLFSFPGMQSPR